MEIFKFKSNLISFLLFFVLGAHVSFGQGSSINFQFDSYNWDYNKWLSVNLTTQLNTNDFDCAEGEDAINSYTVKLDFPSSIKLNYASIEDGKLTMNTSGGLNQLIIEIPIEDCFITGECSGSDFLTISNLRSKNWGCSDAINTIEASLFTCDLSSPIDEDQSDIKLALVEGYRVYSPVTWIKNCKYDRPFSIKLSGQSKSGTNNLYSSDQKHTTDYEFNYDDNRLKCVGVTMVDRIKDFNIKQLKFTDENNTVKFSITGNNYKNFRLYFVHRKGSSSLSQIDPVTNEVITPVEFVANVSTTIKREGCSDLNGTDILTYKLFFNEEKDGTCIGLTDDKTSLSNKPDLWGYIERACYVSSACRPQDYKGKMLYQVDNSFRDEDGTKPIGYSNLAVHYTIGSEVEISSLLVGNGDATSFTKIDENWENETIRVLYKNTNDANDALWRELKDFNKGRKDLTTGIRYKLDDNGFSTNPLTEKLREVVILFPKFKAFHSSPVIEFEYFFSAPHVGSPDPDPHSRDITAKILTHFNTATETEMKKRTITLKSNGASECTIKKLGEFMYWEDQKEFTYGLPITEEDKDHKTILLQFKWKGNLPNHSFKYKLNEILFDVKTITNFKFYSGSFSTSLSKDDPNGFDNKFLSENDFKTENPSFNVNNFDCKHDGEGLINVTNLSLTTSDCEWHYFYVAFDVKYNRHVPAKLYESNDKHDYNDYGYYYTRKNQDIWEVKQLDDFFISVYASCDESLGGQNIKLKAGDEFTYNYEFKNSKSKFYDIISIGVLPYSGDFKTTTTGDVKRGSQVDLSGHAVIELSLKDPDGNDVTPDNLDDMFEVSFAKLSGNDNIKLDGPGDMELFEPQIGGEVPNWQETCPSSGPIAFKVKAKEVFVLEGYRNLIISVKTKIPETAQVGDVLISDFAIQAKNYHKIISDVTTSPDSKIRIAEFSSCDPCPTCITSFQPTPGEKYVVGAWVKQSYKATAEIKFYDYSGETENGGNTNFVKLYYNDYKTYTNNYIETVGFSGFTPANEIAQKFVSKINSKNNGYTAAMNTGLCSSCITVTLETTNSSSLNLKLSHDDENGSGGKTLSQFVGNADYENYDSPTLRVQVGDQQYDFKAKGPIVDGWQRISEVITIPAGGLKLIVELMNEGDHNVWFDDVRFQPFNSSMKTYVYDVETYQLVAELDDENFKSEYIYDVDGNILRVNIESSDGVRTVREKRSYITKRKVSTPEEDNSTTNNNAGWINQILNTVTK